MCNKMTNIIVQMIQPNGYTTSLVQIVNNTKNPNFSLVDSSFLHKIPMEPAKGINYVFLMSGTQQLIKWSLQCSQQTNLDGTSQKELHRRFCPNFDNANRKCSNGIQPSLDPASIWMNNTD